MNLGIPGVVAALLAVLLVSSGVVGDEVDEAPADALAAIEAPADRVSTKSQTLSEVTVEVSIPKSVRLGEKIELSVVAFNNGSGSVWCGDIGYIIESWVRVVDAGGNAVPYTVRGENLLSERPTVRQNYRQLELAPAKSLSWTYGIQDSFEFAKGSHHLSLETKVRIQKFGRSFKMRIQDIPFKVE